MPVHRLRSLLAIVLAAAWASVAAAESGSVRWPIARNRVDPKAFGIQDDTKTVISAASFRSLMNLGGDWNGYRYTPSFGRYFVCYFPGCTNTFIEYYTTLDLPAGAVIDFVGVNNATDSDGVMGVALWQRDRFGATSLLFGYSFPAHGWDTDFSEPLGILVPDHSDKELVIQVEQAPSPNAQYFGWVEVTWHRSVSPAPSAPTFGDVPTSDTAFQYIEALAASGITAGCAGGNYCPDAALTRRQMAIFLAVALGLHWPN